MNITKKEITALLMNTSAIRFSLLCLLFFGSVCVIDAACYFLATPIYVWAGIVLYIKLIKEKKLRKIKHLPIITLFIASGLISVAVNFAYNIHENLFMIYYVILCFFLFYGLYAEKTHEAAKREMTFFFKFFLSSTTILMTISIIILLCSKKGFMFMNYYISIKDNRFVGIFTNANLLAFYAVIGVILCHILYLRHKAVSKFTLGVSLYYGICLFINLVSLFLSDSNGSLVFIIIYVCFIAFYKIFRNSDTVRTFNFIFRIISLVLACVVFAFSFLTIRSFAQEGFAALLESERKFSEIQSIEATSTIPESENSKIPESKPSNSEETSKADNNKYLPSDNTNTENIFSDKKATTFTHENKNIDSGRIPLLKQAIKLFLLYPIFGVAPRNIVLYGEKYLGGLKYSDFHNGFVTILVSFGIVGFTFFIIFAVKIAKSMLICIFKKRNKNDTEREMLPCLLAFLAAYCVYSMFEITLLLDVSFKVLIFWLILGYAMSYLNHYEISDYRGKLHSSTFFPGFVSKIQSAYKDNLDKQNSDSKKDKE
mgnify:FL=1